jgi:hypothetical protein
MPTAEYRSPAMLSPLAPRDRVVVTRDQVSTNLSGEQVILSMRDGVYYGLDRVGARIWALVQHPRTLEDVAARIAEEYGIAPERALADLLPLATQLVERGLLEVVPEADS